MASKSGQGAVASQFDWLVLGSRWGARGLTKGSSNVLREPLSERSESCTDMVEDPGRRRI